MDELEKPKIEELKEEAEFIRDLRRSKVIENRIPKPFPIWKKAVYLTLILLTVFGSAFLLISVDSRKSFLQVATLRLGLSPIRSDDRTFELPPPPPKSAKETTVIQSTGPLFSDDDEFAGILYADPNSSPGMAQDTDADGKPDFVAPPKSKGSEAAFQLLNNQSPLVRSLVEGQLEGYEYQGWNPVQDKSPSFFIDVLAIRSSDQEELHLIWEVNIENERIRPLSQAARDLEQSN